MMTTQATETKPPAIELRGAPGNAHAPADWEAHQIDKQRRADARKSNAKLHRRCLDPVFAGKMEQRKPEYDFLVICTYTRQDKKGRTKTHTAEHKVVAQTEADAWAKWCDLEQVWPSRHGVELTIKNLGQADDYVDESGEHRREARRNSS